MDGRSGENNRALKNSNDQIVIELKLEHVPEEGVFSTLCAGGEAFYFAHSAMAKERHYQPGQGFEVSPVVERYRHRLY